MRDGKLRFVFQRGIGDVVEFPDGRFSTPIPEEQIAEVLEEM